MKKTILLLFGLGLSAFAANEPALPQPAVLPPPSLFDGAIQTLLDSAVGRQTSVLQKPLKIAQVAQATAAPILANAYGLGLSEPAQEPAIIVGNLDVKAQIGR